jgi:hypothetical protein
MDKRIQIAPFTWYCQHCGCNSAGEMLLHQFGWTHHPGLLTIRDTPQGAFCQHCVQLPHRQKMFDKQTGQAISELPERGTREE